MDERVFQRAVAAWLADSFVDVQREVRVDLPDDATGDYVVVDFVAETPFESVVIEVENSIDDLETGLGQALRFAALTGHTPVVVLPASEWTQQRSRYGPVKIVTV